MRYLRADLESLELPHETFDVAFSSLALHYVEDFGRLVGQVFQSLASRGQFVFSIEHPIYMASMRAGWLATNDGGRSWPVDHYAIEGPRVTDWLTRGVRKQHRTLGTTLNALIDAGFTIQRVEEWSPTPEQVAARPSLAEELERPMMVLIAARKWTTARAADRFSRRRACFPSWRLAKLTGPPNLVGPYGQGQEQRARRTAAATRTSPPLSTRPKRFPRRVRPAADG